MAAAIALTLFLQALAGIYKAPRDATLTESLASFDRNGAVAEPCGIPCLKSSGDKLAFVPGIYTFHLRLSVQQEALAAAQNVLISPQIAGSSLRVYLNGILVGQRGDPVSGQSTVWSSAHVFPVPAGILSQDNSLDLEIAGTYEAGIVVRPYLVDAGKHSVRIFLLLLFSNYAIWLSIGGLLVVSFIVLSMGLFEESGREVSILLGIAGLCVAFFLTDFVYIERLPFSLVVFKKMVVSLRHLASALFVIAYLKLLGRKLNAFAIAFIAVQAACFALVIAYPGTIAEIKRLYGYTYLTFLPLQAYLLVIVFLYARAASSFRFIVFGVVVAFLSATRDIVVLIFLRGTGAIMLSHHGFIVLTLSSGMFVVNDALRHYSALATERRMAAGFREEALHDELTGCFNRKILPTLAQDLEKPFSLLAFDIDDFKQVNDSFGHATGDAILVDLVEVAKRNVRGNDFVVRTGGDEFLLILRDCPIEAASALAERLVSDCRKSRVPVIGAGGKDVGTGAYVGYTLSVGVAPCMTGGATTTEDVLETQRLADAELYRAKNSGKNRWCAARSG
ncbi:MAG TPA: GGDEF domain-containing protein [Rectinemataceae bacterium]|nr:GGDEF domain-containing protein [Rectinemataceae bacterium]